MHLVRNADYCGMGNPSKTRNNGVSLKNTGPERRESEQDRGVVAHKFCDLLKNRIVSLYKY